jgi:hypothetical protein
MFPARLSSLLVVVLLAGGFIQAALPVYQLLGAGDRIGLYNHHGKHTFPTAARRLAYRWLDHWLRFRPVREEVGP